MLFLMSKEAVTGEVPMLTVGAASSSRTVGAFVESCARWRRIYDRPMRHFVVPYALPTWRPSTELELRAEVAAVVAELEVSPLFGPLKMFGPTRDGSDTINGSLSPVANPEELIALLHHASPVVRCHAIRALRQRCPEHVALLRRLLCDSSVVVHRYGGCVQDEHLQVWQHALMAILWSAGPAADELKQQLAQQPVYHIAIIVRAHLANERDPMRGAHSMDVISSIAMGQRFTPELEALLDKAFVAEDVTQVPLLTEVAEWHSPPHSAVAGAALLTYEALTLEEKLRISQAAYGSIEELESRLYAFRRAGAAHYPRVFSAVETLVASAPQFAKLQRSLDWCVKYSPRRH